MLAQELAEIGADPNALALVTRAANDEVRHTDLCRRYARAWIGEREVSDRFAGLPKLPRSAGQTREIEAALHLVEMCCLGETFTGAFFTEMLASAQTAVAKALIGSLLEDEIDHGRLGWAHLAEAARDSAIRHQVSQALPTLIERTAGDVLSEGADPARDSPAIERHGYFGPTRSRTIYRTTLVEVVFPGFEALRIDLEPSRRAARDRRWLT